MLTGGGTLSLAVNSPWMWQARMRSSMITGVFDASDRAKACSTVSTIFCRSGRGSSSHMVDFIAMACVRSWITLAPSPESPPEMISAPPITPGEVRFDSASAATLVPTIDFQVTAPRSG